MARRNKDAVHSVYHSMEAKGVFDDNPANAQSDEERDGNKFRTWPVRYPMMFFHPKGEMRVIRQAEVIETPLGPKFVNEQKELIAAMAEGPGDEKKLTEAGWHDHPSKAHAAAGRDTPAVSPGQTIADLQAEIKRMQALVNSESAKTLNATGVSGALGPQNTAKALAAEAVKVPAVAEKVA